MNAVGDDFILVLDTGACVVVTMMVVVVLSSLGVIAFVASIMVAAAVTSMVSFMVLITTSSLMMSESAIISVLRVIAVAISASVILGSMLASSWLIILRSFLVVIRASKCSRHGRCLGSASITLLSSSMSSDSGLISAILNLARVV